MIRGQRRRSVRCSLVLIATALMGPRIAAAGQPVHEVQILARRYTFEPAAIHVVAGEAVRLVVRPASRNPSNCGPERQPSAYSKFINAIVSPTDSLNA